MMTQLVLVAGSHVCSAGWCEATIQLSVKDILTSGSSSSWIPAMQSRERADKGARQLLLSLWLECVIVVVGTYMDVASQSTVCEWHQLQGLNEVIYSQYRQNFRACGGLKTRALRARGNLITPPL